MRVQTHHYNLLIPACILIFLSLLINPLTVQAQNNLSLEEAWSIAFKNNHTIDQQEKLIERAQEEIAIQKTDYYPSLATMGVLARANFDKFPLNLPNASGKVGLDLLSLSVSQPIFSGFRTKNLVESAQEKLVAQEIQKKIIYNTMLLQVGNLYYDIQSNLLQQEAFNSSINRLNIQLTRVQNLYLSEQATPFDTLEISNRKLRTINHLALLEDGYLILQSKLKYLLNEQNIPPVQRLSPASESYSLAKSENFLNLALQFRPELQSISTQKRAQELYSDVLKSRYYPQLSASLAYNFMKIHGDIASGEWTNFYSVLINFQWELWNWKRDSKKVQQSRLDLQYLDIQEKQLIEDIKHQINVAYQNLLSARKKIKLQNRLLEQEKDRYRITENRYNEGLATFLDLNTAELALTEAQTELHKNYITWYKNQLQLDFATGEINQKLVEAQNE